VRYLFRAGGVPPFCRANRIRRFARSRLCTSRRRDYRAVGIEETAARIRAKPSTSEPIDCHCILSSAIRATSFFSSGLTAVVPVRDRYRSNVSHSPMEEYISTEITAARTCPND
jgi:hypothetical protein